MRPDPDRTPAAQQRPKLLVLRSPHVDESAIHQALGDTYDLVTADPNDALEKLAEQDCHAVLAGAGDFLPLERQLISHQASMLLNAIGEGVCLADRRGRVVWSNDRFRSFEALLRDRLRDVLEEAAGEFDRILEDARDRYKATPDHNIQPADLFPPRRHNIALRKSERYYDCIITPVFPLTDTPDKLPRKLAQLAVVVRDVTSRERTQRKINALDRAGRELIHIDPDVVRNMHAAERLENLEQRVARIAHDLLRFDHFSVRVLHEQTNELRVVVSAGMPSEAINIKLSAEPEGQGITGYVASTGRSYNCADASTDPRYVYGMPHPGSSLTVPIRLFDKVIGVLNVESEEVAAFSEQDRQFAEIFASYLAMSFHILNLLVVERSVTRESTTGTIQGEISAPLNDLFADAEALRDAAAGNRHILDQIDRVLKDAELIRGKVKRLAKGPQTLLGIEEALSQQTVDPILKGRRILVVDNEDDIRETINNILTSRGAVVVPLREGQAAIKLLDQWRASYDQTEAFDLVLSDISLDDATGYEVFAAAKAASESLPVILMTGFGYDPHHSIVRASQQGLQSVLFKPFQAQALINDCRKAIDPDTHARDEALGNPDQDPGTT
jgi:CheY-like chemotaxis protein